MLVDATFSKLFAACAVAIFLLVAGWSLAQPQAVLANDACPGGAQLCGEETTCIDVGFSETCETRYFYQDVGDDPHDGDGGHDPREPFHETP